MTTPSWTLKLDAYGRALLDEGLSSAGIEVSVRLTSARDDLHQLVTEAGLQVQTQVGEILIGHVASRDVLQRIANLPSVAEIQVSRPLFGESDPRHPREFT